MNRYRFLIFLLFAFLCISPFNAFAIEDYPGATWGVISAELRDHYGSDLSAGGWVEQGIIWTHWGRTKLNTYARLNVSWDSERDDWANYFGPSVGVALEIRSFDWIGLRTGIEYNLEQRYTSGTTIHKGIAYISWYGMWNLKKK
jgi:hypothetical protein